MRACTFISCPYFVRILALARASDGAGGVQGSKAPGKASRIFRASLAGKRLFFAPDLIAAKSIKACDGGVFRGSKFALKNRAERGGPGRAWLALIQPGGQGGKTWGGR